jgi:hypothetical protein
VTGKDVGLANFTRRVVLQSRQGLGEKQYRRSGIGSVLGYAFMWAVSASKCNRWMMPQLYKDLKSFTQLRHGLDRELIQWTEVFNFGWV